MELSEIKERLNLHEFIENAHRRLKKNTVLSYFYMKLAEDLCFGDAPYMTVKNFDFWSRRIDSVEDRSARVAVCTKFCKGDYYRFQGVKDLQRTNLCRDRFCDNCQNTLAQQRYEKYLPVLENLMEEYDAYHIVFTVPNVYVNELARTINKMYDGFNRLIRYFDGRKRVRGVPFEYYGYVGAVRSLEITKNKKRNDFHPHLHCIFYFRKGLKLSANRTHVNVYSFDNPDVKRKHKTKTVGEVYRYFGNFEIFLQKLWRLIIDGVEVNYSNLVELPLGYSVICDSAEGRFKEIFKYATKGILSVGKENSADSVYEDFCALFFILYRRKITQGYGCLWHCNFEEDVNFLPDEEYAKVIDSLHSIENPDEYYEDFKDMYDEITGRKQITYISRRSVKAIVGKEFDGEDWVLKK